MKTWHMVVDVALCQGCNNCFLACKDEHVGNEWPGYSRPQSLHGERWIEIPCRERGQYPLIDVVYRPTLCTHCADAPCVTRSGGAIRKRADGIVLIDPAAAGRRELVEACPYGMIVWSEEIQAAQKCTLCAHLLDSGWLEPRCVQACGPGALSMVYEEEEVFGARAAAEGLVTLHPPTGRQSVPECRQGSTPVRGAPIILGRTGVCYKNLWRFESCFIAGSVAWEREGVLDCAAGVTVILRRARLDQEATGVSELAKSREGATSGNDGQSLDVPSVATLSTTCTDAFGDFRFDGLEPDSGRYEVEIVASGYEPVLLRPTLGSSLNLGTITLKAPASETPSASTVRVVPRRTLATVGGGRR